MTSHKDLLDQYIDARNSGSAGDFELPEDPELRELFQTVDQVQMYGDIEWPEFDLAGQMSQTLQEQLGREPSGAVTAGERIEGDEATTASGPAIGSSRIDDDDQGGWRWYTRQFAGMAAAAAVVALFALGLAYILGGWGGNVHAPGTAVEEGQIPGTILYVEYHGRFLDDEANQTIARIDADGTNQQDLASRPVPTADRAGVAWSPDGQWVAYIDPESGSRDAPAVVSLVSADGRETESIDMDPVEGTMRLTAGLTWSDDGNHLAFVHQDPETDQHRIAVVHRPTGEMSPVMEANMIQGNQSHPAWMPGELTMAFSQMDADGQRSIFVHDGTGEPVPIVEDDHRAIQPAWSPDGTSLAYVGSSEDGERGNVHVVELGSGQTTNITEHDGRWDYMPTWSSRDQIAFMSDFGDMEYDIFVVNPDGSDLRNLTEDVDWHANIPDWSDDGRYLTFTSVNEDQDRWRINVYDIDEDRLYTVHESENPLFYAQWRPEAEPTEVSRDLDMEDVEINLSDEQIEMIQRSVEQFLSEDETPAVQINDEVITAEQIAHQVEVARTTRIAYDGVPHADQLPEETRRFHEEMEALTQETGLENVVLVGLLASSAVQQWAEQQGLSATQEQIDEEVARQRDLNRQMRERVPKDETLPQDIIIDAIGEDRYWDEYLPWSLQGSLTEQNVNQALMEEADIDYDGQRQAVLQRDVLQAEFRAELVREADIEVIDEEALGEADLDTAIEYVTETYPSFLREHRDEYPDPDSQEDPATQDDATGQYQSVEDVEAYVQQLAEEREAPDTEILEIRRLTFAEMAEEMSATYPEEAYDEPIWRVEVRGFVLDPESDSDMSDPMSPGDRNAILWVEPGVGLMSAYSVRER